MSLYNSTPIEKTIPQGCPWHEAQVAYGTPNVDWCEPTICSWINEPANTWSNIGFILVSLWLIKKFTKNKLLKNYGIIVMTMGTFSAIYHATNNYFSQHLDFFGMSLFVSYIMAFQWLRASQQKKDAMMSYFWFFTALNLVLLIVLGFIKIPIQSLLLMNAIPIILLEIYIALFLKKYLPVKYFIMSIIALILAQIFAQIDLKRIYCNPENILFHGHVLWHITCAMATSLIAMHFQARAHEIES